MKIITFLKTRFRKWLNEEIWLKDYIKAGLKVGSNCNIHSGVVFDISHCWLIEIGNNVTIAPFTYFLAHDASTQNKLNYTKIGKVIVEDNVFIGARSIVLAGVTIGENSIIAAGSVISKSIPANSVFGGNPAKYIMSTDELIDKHKDLIKNAKVYDESWLINSKITNEMKYQMSIDLENKMGYIV